MNAPGRGFPGRNDAKTFLGRLDHVAGIVQPDAVATCVLDHDRARGLVRLAASPIALELEQYLQPRGQYSASLLHALKRRPMAVLCQATAGIVHDPA